MERRSRAAAAGALGGGDVSLEEWVGVGFRLGTERFLVPRGEVREVLMVPPAITRVPGAKSWVRGLANVRGHLLPVVDLKEFLGSGVGGTERTRARTGGQQQRVSGGPGGGRGLRFPALPGPGAGRRGAGDGDPG